MCLTREILATVFYHEVIRVVRAIKVKGIEIELKTPGNFSTANIKKIAGTEFNLKTDYIIQAIGTRPGGEITKIAPKLKTKGKGTIVVKDTFATNIPGVFAGGDVINGGNTIVQAIGDGKKAAQSIIDFIKKRDSQLY